MTDSAEKDAGCVLCGDPLWSWPCGASWDSEHRPLTPETRVIPPAKGATEGDRGE